MYNYRQHDLSAKTLAFLEEGDRLITNAEKLLRELPAREQQEHWEYIQELYDKYFRL